MSKSPNAKSPKKLKPEEEIEWRRDKLLRRLLHTQPQPRPKRERGKGKSIRTRGKRASGEMP